MKTIIHYFLTIIVTLLGRNIHAQVMVKDINLTGGSYPYNFTNVNGTLFFTANDGNSGVELWKSDGTTGGTIMIKDILAGSTGSMLAPTGLAYLTNINGTLYFAAYDATNGRELWKSDGTAAGTVLVKDINTGTGDSKPSYLTNVNGTLFFAADDGINGIELWKSDGTATGTIMVKDINSGSGSSIPSNLSSYGNFINVNGILFFVADDGTNGYEFWKSDGTAAGTVLLKDISPGSASPWTYGYPVPRKSFNDTLYFTANDGTNGMELWKSDGTSIGTTMVKDINPGSGSSDPDYLTIFNDTLYFGASDGTNGKELWKSDGTSAGTLLLMDINSGAGNSNPGAGASSSPGPRSFTIINSTIYFAATTGSVNCELWKSDGTAAGTVLIKDIYSGSIGSSPAYLTNVNDTLYFNASTGTTSRELWKSDGTTNGTVMVSDINPGISGSFSVNTTFMNINNVLYFMADDGTNGHELWVLGTSTSSSINEKTNSNHFSIYPNPCTGKFIIENKNVEQIEIYNTIGEKIFSAKTNSDKTEIDLISQPKGIYFVTVNYGTRIYTRKIIVQ